ncbi:Uncharacterised protein [Shigella sonnei]|nr:Uncharacterised protein [Shigella sonnei]
MLSKGVLSARLFNLNLWLTLSGFCFGANRDSDLFGFSRLLQIFHRVICAGQPGRDYSRLYQHDQLSDSGSAKQN